MAQVVPAPDFTPVMSFLLGMKRLKEEKRQFDVSQQNEQQRIELQRQGNALAMLQEAKQFVPKGTKISQAPILHPILKTLGMDWSQLVDASGQEAEVNPMGATDVLDDMTKRWIAENKDNPEMGPVIQQALQSGVLSNLTKVAGTTPTSMALTEQKGKLQQAGLNTFETAAKLNPGLLYNMAKAEMGLPPEVNFVYKNKKYNFESADAGRLALGFAELDQNGWYQTGQLNAQAAALRNNMVYQMSKDFSDTLQKQNIVYSPPQIYRLIDAQVSGQLNQDWIDKNPDIAPIATLVQSSALAVPGLEKMQLQLSPQGQTVVSIANLVDTLDPEGKIDVKTRMSMVNGWLKAAREAGLPVPKVHDRTLLGLIGKKTPSYEFTGPEQKGPKHGNKQDFQSLESLSDDQLKQTLIQGAAQLYSSGVPITQIQAQYPSLTPPDIATVITRGSRGRRR